MECAQKEPERSHKVVWEEAGPGCVVERGRENCGVKLEWCHRESSWVR